MDDYIHLKIQDIYMTLRMSKKKGSAHIIRFVKAMCYMGFKDWSWIFMTIGERLSPTLLPVRPCAGAQILGAVLC